MRPLSAILGVFIAIPSSAQVVVGEAAAAGASSAAAVAPAPDAPVLALAPSLIAAIDAKELAGKAKSMTPAEWGKLVEKSQDGGTKAVLRSMAVDNPSDPRLTVKLKNGETIDGAFRGVASDKMVFESGGKLLGLGLDSGNIAEVTRTVDLMFDGAVLEPGEVTVFGGPAVVDPFKDLASYMGRIVEVDARDLDDLKYSARSYGGRVIKADGEEVQLASAKGISYLQKRHHRIDSVALRTEHYSSYGKIAAIDAVDGKVPLGASVVLVENGGKKTAGRYRGLRKDAEGSFVVIETDESGGSRFRAFRDFHDLRTAGYDEGELLPGSEPLYSFTGK